MAFSGPAYRTTFLMDRKSAIPADTAEFSLHWNTQSGVAATGTELANMLDAVEDFLSDTASGAVHPVQYYLGNVLKRAGTHIAQTYLIPNAPGPVGVPIDIRTFAFSGGGGGLDLPSECAIVLSFHGDYTTIAEHGAGGTRPKARWRNRIYLGPVTDASENVDATTGEVTVSSGCRTDLTAAAKAMASDFNAAGLNWKTFSPTDWNIHNVVGGWVDNAYDTQRRRGLSATVRTTFVFP